MANSETWTWTNSLVGIGVLIILLFFGGLFTMIVMAIMLGGGWYFNSKGSLKKG